MTHPSIEAVAQSLYALCDGDLSALRDPNTIARTTIKAFLATPEMVAVKDALKQADSHTKELRDAWQRGAINECDGLGGTRSNRNVDTEVAVREALAQLETLIAGASE